MWWAKRERSWSPSPGARSGSRPARHGVGAGYGITLGINGEAGIRLYPSLPLGAQLQPLGQESSSGSTSPEPELPSLSWSPVGGFGYVAPRSLLRREPGAE